MDFTANHLLSRLKNGFENVIIKLISRYKRNTIPFCFWLISFFFYRRFYIFNVDFFLPEILFLRVAEILLLGWIIFDPFSMACKTPAFILMKNILPVIIILSFVFLEHYFYISIFLFLAIFIIVVTSYVLLHRHNRKQTLYKRKRIKIRPVLQRIFVMTSVLLLLIPAIIGVFLLNEPIKKVPSVANLETQNIEEIDDLFLRHSASLKKLASKSWKALNADEKMNLAQIIVNIESESLGIPSVAVVGVGLPLNLLGQYNVAENSIILNLSLITKKDATEFVTTLCHEIRHAYQYYVVQTLDWDDLSTVKWPLYVDARAWKAEYDSTEITNDYEIYYNRSIEIDARSYSESRLAYYSDYM